MVLEHRVPFKVEQLITKEELSKRWLYATEEEIYNLYKKGALRVYSHLKGPIDGVLFCTPAHIGFWDGCYDFDFFDYYLLEDIFSREKEYPDFTGNTRFTKFSLGMPENIPIRQIQKEMRMSPQELVDFLNDDSVPNRLITSYEEGFRNFINQKGFLGSSSVPYFTVTMLDDDELTVHRLDWENFQTRERADTQIANLPFPTVSADTFGLESQFAEVLKEKDASISALKVALDVALKGVEKIAGANNSLNSKKSPPLKGHLDVIRILGPAVGKRYPLSQDTVVFLMDVANKYPYPHLLEEIAPAEKESLLPTGSAMFTPEEFESEWIETKRVRQSFIFHGKVLRRILEELDATSIFLLRTMLSFYLTKDTCAKLEQQIEDADDVRQGDKQFLAELAELQKALKEKNARIAELETQLAAATPSLTSQQKATLVKGENTLKAWKPAIASMIRVAVRCGEEGRVLRQQPDFNLMFNELDAELNGEQIKFFRESLPDEHIDRLGDARAKAAPPDND